MNDNLSRNHFTCYCFVLLLVCNVVLAVVSGTTNGRKNDRNTGGRWYDKTKWSNAARNSPPVVEGSGNSDIVSDLDETPRGLGPDDEDSETGSGAMESPGSVEEGSGIGGIKFETSTGSPFDATHLTTSNVTKKLTNEPGVSTKLPPSDSVTEAALFLTTTLAQRPVTQQEPVHSTHKVPGYPVGSRGDTDADDDEEDEDEDDEDHDGNDDEDLYSFGAGAGSSAAPFIPPIVVDADPQQPSFTVTQPSARATIAVKPPISIESMLPTATTPSSGVVTTPSSSAQPPSTDDDMYDRTPDKRKDRHGFQWIFSEGVLTAVIGGAVVGLLAAILLVMFVVYRMRKKDEGSYVLDEPKAPPTYPYAYNKAPAREFYA